MNLNINRNTFFKAGVTLLSAVILSEGFVFSTYNVKADNNESYNLQQNVNDDLNSNQEIIESPNFDSIVDREIQNANIPQSLQDKAKKQMIDFYNPDSPKYLKIVTLTAWSGLGNVSNNQFQSVLAHGWVSTNVLGSALNVVIGAALGGGAGSLISLVRSRGKAYAINVLKSRVQKTLIDMGLKRAGYLLTGAMEFALDFTSPGSAIAKYIDNHDKKPGNGYIELT